MIQLYAMSRGCGMPWWDAPCWGASTAANGQNDPDVQILLREGG